MSEYFDKSDSMIEKTKEKKKTHMLYENEREGQIDFFNNYQIPYDGDQSILIDNTDGVYNGNIMEFKLNISNLNKVLFQTIKYLSRMRIKGEDIPATILLIDLNNRKVYQYKSIDYKNEIQKVYIGAASKDNDGFTAKQPEKIYDYVNMVDSSKLKHQLKDKKSLQDSVMPIDIDENCIVGWAERYYRECPNATKGDFLGDENGKSVAITGEIRKPRHFLGRINPYIGKTNEKFKYLMDCLNDRLSKKDLGAFYTPVAYAKKSVELVKMAVQRALDAGKKDYIILDRCAGTGNLESALIGLFDKNGEELISHCVVSTYEYYEYKVLNERIGDKVRDIIPPTEADVVYENGKVSNADAMSEDFINNPIIKSYIDNKDCAIILFENPPYADSSASDNSVNGDRTQKAKTNRKNTYVAEQFKKQIKLFNTTQSSSRELSNLFIWSGFKYYLRQSTDSYIIFSPVKYFKSIGLVKKHFVLGYAFNRKYFHATESVISYVLWTNEDDLTASSWKLEVHDIDDDNNIQNLNKDIIVKSVKYPPSKYADLRKFENDVETTVSCASNGYPIIGYQYKKGRKPIYNDNNIAYMTAINFPINAVNYRLTRCNTKSELEQSFGFHLRKDNYFEKLPVWCSKLFSQDEWYDRDVYFSTSDGGDTYTKDIDFLKSCLIYTCLSNQNKCLTFDGSDGRHYQNELCFDKNTLASNDLSKMKLDDEEKELLKLWNEILKQAKDTGKCIDGYTYGIYQITKEINTFKVVGTGKTKKRVYDYPQLNGNLETLKTKLKAYYKSHITDKLFKYELLK